MNTKHLGYQSENLHKEQGRISATYGRKYSGERDLPGTWWTNLNL